VTEGTRARLGDVGSWRVASWLLVQRCI
jgi:hypothetical protein